MSAAAKKPDIFNVLMAAICQAFASPEARALPITDQIGILLSVSAALITSVKQDAAMHLATALVAAAKTPEQARAAFEIAMAAKAVKTGASPTILS